jgi:hypothetical protein
VCHVLARPESAAEVVRSLLGRDSKPEHAAQPPAR